MLEPCEAKVSRTVLRGLGLREGARLLGVLSSFLCSCRRTAAAVNCFETEAMRNLVWGVLVTANSQLAMP